MPGQTEARPQSEEVRRKADEEEEVLPEEGPPSRASIGQEQRRHDDDEELPEEEAATGTTESNVTWVGGFPVKVDKSITEENGESAVAKLVTRSRKNTNTTIRDMAKRGEDILSNAVNRVRANSGMKPTAGEKPTASDLTKYRVRIVSLFRAYDPDRVISTDRLLSANVGHEEECIAKLVAELGPEPPPGPSPFQARYIRIHNHYGRPLVRMQEQLDDYAGKEEELMKLLVSQLGPEPTDDEDPVDPALRKRLIRFYEKWNPAKLAMVDDVLARLASREEELFQKLVAKYGPEPDPEEVIDVVPQARPRAKSERFVDPVPQPGGRANRRATLSGVPVIDPLSPMNSSFSKSYSPTKKRLMRFYLQYNPEKLSSVNTMLESYRGEEKVELLFKKLVSKYGPEPEWGDEDELRVDDDTRMDYSACLMDSSSPRKSLRRFDSYSSPGSSANLRRSASASASPSPPRKGRATRATIISDAARVSKMLSSNPKLPKWDSDYQSWIGQPCTIVKENPTDHTVAVVFKDGKGAWFPKDCVIPEGQDRRSSVTESVDTQKGIATTPTVESEGEDDDVADKQSAPQSSGATAVAEEGFPSQYAVSSLTFAKECSGQYNLLDETVNGYPVWSRVRSDAEDVEAYLFSTPTGEWRVSDDREDFETGAGYFNTDTHNGKKPHELRTWYGEDDDVPDKNISCKPIDHSKGDRIEGGHLIVGRVVAELSEEELQYASFQRRKRFRTKETISSKCEICVKFDSICSTCYVSRLKAQQERRKYLKAHFAGWDLRKRVGVFFAAVAAGEDEDVKLMVESGAADPNWMAFFKKKPSEHNNLQADGSQVTPLHVACAYHRPDVVKVLVMAGARYCRDQYQMLPLDYVTDEDANHDITMYLSECTPDYNITLEVMEVWDIYHDGDYEEARNAFSELVVKFPDRDTCHLGLVYCHLALGDVEKCLSTATTTLQGTHIKWVECQRIAIQKAMDRANELRHEVAHAEPTEGCIKSCGCVVYPDGWIVPLKALRKTDFSVVKNIFSFLPCSSAWHTWIALHRSELLRKSVDSFVTSASRQDPRDALRIFTTVPAWLASYKEAVTDRVFEGWNTTRYGELGHVVVEDIECESIITFPYFITKVTCVLTHVNNSALTKFKRWFSKDQRTKPTPRQRISAANIKAMDDGERVVSFSLTLKDPTESLGVDYKVMDSSHVKIVKVLDGPALAAGMLPGIVLSVNGTPISQPDLFLKVCLRPPLFRRSLKENEKISVNQITTDCSERTRSQIKENRHCSRL
eukprot:TRINITY_DN733_c3_g1_i1.p1 TRINITY_DN733_c3_g1~~TRINITY_DN733_c3_g1_i1.p1  ORF type:complete len:1271 (+),score=277.30 TRINITY_DN733_c3_g1_i1:41-3853(+)